MLINTAPIEGRLRDLQPLDSMFDTAFYTHELVTIATLL